MRTHLGINAKVNLVVELSGPRRHMCDGVVVFVREEGKFFWHRETQSEKRNLNGAQVQQLEPFLPVSPADDSLTRDTR
jgi:hypothetical protein